MLGDVWSTYICRYSVHRCCYCVIVLLVLCCDVVLHALCRAVGKEGALELIELCSSLTSMSRYVGHTAYILYVGTGCVWVGSCMYG